MIRIIILLLLVVSSFGASPKLVSPKVVSVQTNAVMSKVFIAPKFVFVTWTNEYSFPVDYEVEVTQDMKTWKLFAVASDYDADKSGKHVFEIKPGYYRLAVRKR